MRFQIPLGVTALATLAVASSIQSRETKNDFDWSSITPSKKLEYHQCFDGYKCARLEVPLDWNKPSNYSHSVAIGIVTLPATVHNSDPSFGGPVLINPGGPSGSGTQMTFEYGKYFQDILDGDRHYEIVGFDPRGVGNSTPPADCYHNDLLRTADELQAAGMPSVGAGSAALSYLYGHNKGVSKLCGKAGNDSILSHMSTASVARDMLEIVERADELKSTSSNSTKTEDPKLQYVGVSYGTFLGNTFASMFPGRVGRMVIDGVEDPDDYIKGTWLKNLNDFETALDDFYDTCFKADADCLLKTKSDEDASAIRKRVESFIVGLEKEPVSALFNGRTHLVTSLVVRNAIRTSLYNPIGLYEPLSAVLASSIAGNYTALLSAVPQTTVEIEDACAAPNVTFPPSSYSWTNEAGAGILCGDSAFDADDRSLSWAEKLVSSLYKQSPTAGESWAKIPLSCVGWKFKPSYHFRGPFGTPSPSSKTDGDVPEAPLLILSNRVDIATPLQNAYAVSRSHESSAVVIQESVGHCALITSKSKCTANIVKEYFNSGKMPKNGTVCEQDCEASIPLKTCPGLPSPGQ